MISDVLRDAITQIDEYLSWEESALAYKPDQPITKRIVACVSEMRALVEILDTPTGYIDVPPSLRDIMNKLEEIEFAINCVGGSDVIEAHRECHGDPACDSPIDETIQCGACDEYFCVKHLRDGFCIACIDEPADGGEIDLNAETERERQLAEYKEKYS